MKNRHRSKPDSDDRAVAIYHVVYAHEGFAKSAQALFRLVRNAQETAPGRKRLLFLDVEGHRNSEGGFDADMLELQNEFLTGFLSPFLSEVHSPLTNVENTRAQQDDVPPELIIDGRGIV